ncbi:ATP-binding cassette sub- A member 3 [Bulinus truncatus]|nr:ATP-binding cassette sub- A member 3 [Bulinus truncatus]
MAACICRGGVLASYNMTVMRVNIPFEGVFYWLHLVFSLVCPNYSLTTTFFFFVHMAFRFHLQRLVHTPTMKEYFEFKLHKLYFYENLVSLAAVMAMSWVIVALVEYRVGKLLWYTLWPEGVCGTRVTDRRISTHEDEDVSSERIRISTTPLDQLLSANAIVLQDLRKQYLTRCSFFVAVHGTSICVPHNECLGLLGQNGAGKSTTFKMLTGDEMISSGNAYMDGLNVKTRMKKIKSMMGYCPQQGALHDTLTGRETLYFTSLGAAVQAVIDLVTLAPHDNKITQYYSGGNKRKLSVGISIIGDPDFIMLDEPTAGMDPIARRKLWDVLHLIRTSGRTLVLTSHSMEECEALCTRIAIMAHGYVLCLGSSQHLKSKYGKGYTVILHAAKVADGRAVPLSEAEKYVLDTGDSKRSVQVPVLHRPADITRTSISEAIEDRGIDNCILVIDYSMKRIRFFREMARLLIKRIRLLIERIRLLIERIRLLIEMIRLLFERILLFFERIRLLIERIRLLFEMIRLLID